MAPPTHRTINLEEMDLFLRFMMGRKKKACAKVQKREFKEGDFVWTKIPGMKMMWPAQVVKLSRKEVVAYVKSDDDNFIIKKSECSMIPFGEHFPILKAEGIESLKSQKGNLRAFLSDVTWASTNIHNNSSEIDINDHENQEDHDFLDHESQSSDNSSEIDINDHENQEDHDFLDHESQSSDNSSEIDINDHENQEDHDFLDHESQSSDNIQKAKRARVEDTYVENSSSDGEMSDVYPALTLQVPVVVNTDDAGSDSDDEDIDEDSILRDVKNPNIYITKVMTSFTSKTGKAKKHQRVYNSYQYCGNCEKKVSNLSQHLVRNLQVHQANEKIIEIQEETDPMTKKKLQTLLRGKFNHDFNMLTLKKGKGEILLERRPTKEFKLQDYGPCPNCLLWFAKALLKKHGKSCVNKKLDNLTTGDLTTQSECISGQLISVASKQLVKEVFSKMRRDQITEVVKGDLLITQLGNQWLEKNVGNVLKRGVYTSQILRLIGRFLIILRRIKPINGSAESSLWDYLKPSHFDVIVKASILTASPMEDEDDLKAPSNAIKIGYDLKRLLSGKIGLSIIHDRPADAEDAEKMLKLMSIYWGTKVTKMARVILLERSYYAKKNLPLPGDIQRLTMYLRKRLADLDYTQVNRHNYRQIAEAVQAKLVIYNRRRTGEMQAARLRDYERRCCGIEGEHLVGSCSELEKKLLESQEVMTIRGKVGRAVPVILPDEVKKGLQYLTDSSVRSKVGVSPSNRYLFASEGESIVWAYDSVKKAAEAACLDTPEAVTSTSLRKYMATVTQVLDLKESQMQWVINHLGHTMDVHKLHYRATSDILERTQIAKILLLQDQGRIGQFKNMGLEEIDLKDIVFQEQEQTCSTYEEQTSNIDDSILNGPVKEITAIDFDSPDVIDETLNEAETFFGETGSASKQRKRPVSTVKTSWSVEEEKEIKSRFMKFFDKKIRPKPADCLRVIEKSRKENGLLGSRRKDVLKKKVFRMIDKLNHA